MMTTMSDISVRPKRKPSLVLFDMDGVLFDTMPYHADSWYTTAKAYGLEATRMNFISTKGKRGVIRSDICTRDSLVEKQVRLL